MNVDRPNEARPVEELLNRGFVVNYPVCPECKRNVSPKPGKAVFDAELKVFHHVRCLGRPALQGRQLRNARKAARRHARAEGREA
jgi:hypothetical protein